MAEPSTIARPYAEAVFKLAAAQDELAQWSAALSRPGRRGRRRAHAGGDSGPQPRAGEGGGAHHRRAGGQALRRRGEPGAGARGERPPGGAAARSARSTRRSRTSAKACSKSRSSRRSRWMTPRSPTSPRRLERKTGRKVRARVTVDSSLIGGARILIGDKVIDGSVRAQLSRSRTHSRLREPTI